jgi:hypothetical protein
MPIYLRIQELFGTARVSSRISRAVSLPSVAVLCVLLWCAGVVLSGAQYDGAVDAAAGAGVPSLPMPLNANLLVHPAVKGKFSNTQTVCVKFERRGRIW